tara:strand:- start:359 stop:601 length:243 start_codon:yes stop_codon:yes gene_type:complete
MKKELLIERINNFLIEDFEIDSSIVKPNAKIIDELHIDSLDFVDIVVFIEEEFNVKLDASDLNDVKTLQDFYELIQKKIK